MRLGLTAYSKEDVLLLKELIEGGDYRRRRPDLPARRRRPRDPVRRDGPEGRQRRADRRPERHGPGMSATMRASFTTGTGHLKSSACRRFHGRYRRPTRSSSGSTRAPSRKRTATCDGPGLHLAPHARVAAAEAAVLGLELAGVVEALGSAVTSFQPGDRVFGMRSGAHAEFVCVRESGYLGHMPTDMTFEEAAAVSDGANQALSHLKRAKVGPGTRLLVYGASGSAALPRCRSGSTTSART